MQQSFKNSEPYPCTPKCVTYAAANPEQNEAARGKGFPETGLYLDEDGTQRRRWKPVIFLILWRENKRKQKETEKAWWVLKISHVVMKPLKDCDNQWNVKKVNSVKYLAIFSFEDERLVEEIGFKVFCCSQRALPCGIC